MPIRKTASGGQVTGVEPAGEYVAGTEEREWTPDDWRQHTAAVRIDQYPPARPWTPDDELGLEIEDSRD